MMLIITMTALLALLIASIVAYRVALRGYIRVSAAWPAREQLARLAGKIEQDAKAPAELKSFATFAADNAFNRPTLRRVAMTCHAAQTPDPGDIIEFRQAMISKYGEFYALEAESIVKAFSVLVFIEDERSIRRIRRIKSFYCSPDAASKIDANGHVRPVWDTVRNYPDGACAA